MIERAPKGRNQLSAELFGVVLRPENRRAVAGVEMGIFLLEFRLFADVDYRLSQAFRIAR